MSDTASARGLHAALVRNTGYLVSRMGWFASRRFGERLAALGLTARMWGALNVLDAEGEISQQQLGRAIGMDPSSVVATIDELETRGLVERRRHPTDRRAHALHLTGAGRATLARGRQTAREAQEELLAPLSAGERAHLHELLLRMAIAAGQVDDGDQTGDDGQTRSAAGTGDTAAGDAAQTGDTAAGDAAQTGDTAAGEAAQTGDTAAGEAAQTGDAAAGEAAQTGDTAAGGAAQTGDAAPTGRAPHTGDDGEIKSGRPPVPGDG